MVAGRRWLRRTDIRESRIAIQLPFTYNLHDRRQHRRHGFSSYIIRSLSAKRLRAVPFASGRLSNHLHIQPGAKQDPSPRDRTSSGNLSPSDFCPWLFPLSALPLALSALPLALLGAPSCHGVDGSLARRRQLSTPTVVASRPSTLNLSHGCPWSGLPWSVVSWSCLRASPLALPALLQAPARRTRLSSASGRYRPE